MSTSAVVTERSPVAYARKRLRQGLRGLDPVRAGAHLDRSALELLSPAQRARFLEMPAFDQQHLCRVANHLREQGITDRDVILAGLLHDIGKFDGVRAVRLTDRVGKVVLKRISPATLQNVASSYPRGRFPGLALTVRHPELGAEIARSLGCSERTCWLIRNHEAETDLGDPDLARLQAADFAS
ncbi:MAG: HD domain-containing protein [Thermomicrobiales bacterium]|nr:HD domain-containing protein [Thermomicrobiales bacterium]